MKENLKKISFMAMEYTNILMEISMKENGIWVVKVERELKNIQ